MSTYQERIAAYQRKETQVIVSQSQALRDKWEGQEFGQILKDIKATGEPEFIHWGDNNVAGFKVRGEHDVDYYFNCSQSLSDIMEDKGFPGDTLTLLGRQYDIQRPVLEPVLEGGITVRRPKMVNGVPMTETVKSFNIGLPQGFRKVVDSKPISEYELSAEEMAALLAE